MAVRVAGAGARSRAGAEIMAKVGAGAEKKEFRLRNTGYQVPVIAPSGFVLCS